MTDHTHLTYSPGRWVAVSSIDQWLLVDLAAEDPVVRRCWKLMSEQSGVDAVLDALLSAGVGRAPGFVLISLRESERRAVSRFPATAVLHLADAEAQVIDAAAGVSWTDVLLADLHLDGVTLRGPVDASSSVELPMGTGVTTAGVVHVWVGSPVASAPAQLSTPPPSPAPTRPMPTSGTEPPEPASAPPSDAASTIHPEESPSYDFLFGATMRPDEMSPSAPPPSPPPAPPQASPVSAPLDATLAPPEVISSVTPPSPSGESGDPGLIDMVPWLDRDAAPVSGPPPMAAAPTSAVPTADAAAASVAPAVDVNAAAAPDVSATVNRAALAAVAQAASVGPTVLAGYCPSRHLSPPHAARCRVCSAPMPPQHPFEIARPALGVLRLGSGEVITLDRGVVLGRSPELPDGDSADRPHVLRLTSPENDISRTHAEVVLDGWNVYVRDFGSVNGTTVTLPGQPPERLRENNPQLIENGTVITLADEVSLTFEVTT